jgi:hypothetical protein
VYQAIRSRNRKYPQMHARIRAGDIQEREDEKFGMENEKLKLKHVERGRRTE